MNDLRNTIWMELLKAARSRVPLFTLLGFLMLPMAGAFFMIVYKDPAFARSIGLIGAKAELAGGSADWPFYLSLFAQGIAVGGLILFSFVVSWVFGREFADGTFKDLLAVPVPRGNILAAKFMIVVLWSALLAAVVYAVGLALGALIGLGQGGPAVIVRGSLIFAGTSGLVILSVLPLAFFASAGRGYLPPMGAAVLLLALANILAVLGWGGYFPWSIPGFYAGFAGSSGVLEPASLWIVLLTGAAGILGTYLWWKYADQSR